ncbi:phosphomannomutase/phosphoglucomutase [Candidatus Bathyarchaeota archaeon A05DMB-2]|jgi:phosphomannomutase|nr:phosphomannomutase/phosphoglucomutase [Candidatus Bathyarchaeota archaeon A05DMB-2]
MSIFRAYDIRGIYGKDLTEEVMKKIGMAVGTYQPGNFTVGRDFREHSDQLEEAFISGLVTTGSNVHLVGTCPASLCVFSNWKLKNNVAAYITASHLPAEWNGVKFFHQDGVGFFEDENKKLEQIHKTGPFRKGAGTVTEVGGMEEEYISFIQERIKPKKLKVVVDFGNGAACLLVPKILKRLTTVEARYLYDWPDPTFPNRDPEPKPESLTALSKKVVEENADLGVAFDADGDRALFVDEKGEVMMAEQSAVLFIRDLMKTRRGPVVANIECSSLIDEEAQKYGQNVFRIPVGHTFLVQQTQAYNAILGVEKSGHICVPKFYWFDDAIINSIYLIEIVSNLGRPVSEIIREMPVEFFERVEIDSTDEAKFKIVDAVMQEAAEKYEKITAIDGVRIDFPDSWALIRASNTSPKLRLTVEAKTERRLHELKKEIMALISDAARKQD